MRRGVRKIRREGSWRARIKRERRGRESKRGEEEKEEERGERKKKRDRKRAGERRGRKDELRG